MLVCVKMSYNLSVMSTNVLCTLYTGKKEAAENYRGGGACLRGEAVEQRAAEDRQGPGGEEAARRERRGVHEGRAHKKRGEAHQAHLGEENPDGEACVLRQIPKLVWRGTGPRQAPR